MREVVTVERSHHTYKTLKKDIFKGFGRNQKERKDQRKALKTVLNSLKAKIYPELDLNIGRTAIYNDSDFLDVLTFVALEGDFTNNGANTYGFMKTESVPHPRTVRYHILKLDKETIEKEFDNATDKILEIAKKQRKLQGRFDVAIDITDHPYYGDKNTKGIVYTKVFRGTWFAYRYATICIVVNGQRFTLKSLPMNEFTPKHKIVKELIEFAQKRINIGIVYLDRGFFQVKVINLLKSIGITFLMPAVRNKRIKVIMGENPSPTIMRYTMGDKRYNPASFNLIIVEDSQKIKRVFATNLNVKEKDAKNLFSMYSKRWGIETSYRLQKHQFKAKTTSKNFNLRLFLFMFSVALYNLWVLLNIVLSVEYKKKLEKPLITVKMFGMVLIWNVDDG